MSPVHEYKLSVPAAAIDGNGHANNVEYVRWMADAAKSHANACGGSGVVMRLGAAWVGGAAWVLGAGCGKAAVTPTRKQQAAPARRLNFRTGVVTRRLRVAASSDI